MNRAITTAAVAGLTVASLAACSALPGTGWKSDVRASVEAATAPDPELCDSMEFLGVESGDDMAAIVGLTPEMIDFANDMGPLMAEDFGQADDFDFTSVPDDQYGDAMLYAVNVAYEITCS